MEEENEIIHEANESQIRNVNEFKIEDYIKSAFKIYRKYFWEFAGFYAIMVLISISIPMIFGAFTGSSIFSFGKQANFNPYITYLVVGPINGFLSFLLGSGVFIVARKINFNQTYSFDNFFDGTKHWKELLIACLITYLVTLIFLSLPMKDLVSLFLGRYNPTLPTLTTPLLFKSKLLAGIFLMIGIYFTIAFTWVQQLIIFSGMNYQIALITSLKLISKRFFSFAGLYVILGAIILLPVILIFLLMIFVGESFNAGHSITGIIFMVIWIIPCLLWIFLAMPVLHITLYTAFEDIVGSNNNEQRAMNNEQLQMKENESNNNKLIIIINKYKILITVVFILFLGVIIAFFLRSNFKNQIEPYDIVNQSMLKTSENFTQKLQKVNADFEKKRSENPEKFEQISNKARQVEKLSNDMVNYIKITKAELIAKIEGISIEKAKETPLSEVKNKEDYKISTNYFLGNSKDGSEGKARELKIKVNEYRKQLTMILGKDSSEVKLGLDIKGNRQANWEMGNFYQTISAGSITILNKLIVDVKNAELDVTIHLYKGLDE